jgi:CheY-like chemotaxis protein
MDDSPDFRKSPGGEPERPGRETQSMGPKARVNDLHLTGLVEHSESMLRPHEDRPKHLLVVDDDPRVQDLLQEVLSGAGYRVQTAFDSDEAMQHIAQRNFDGLVLDLVLPEEDGLALYDRILELNPYLRNRIIFISGEAREHQLHRVAKKTGIGVLQKPFNILDLIQVLRDRGL